MIFTNPTMNLDIKNCKMPNWNQELNTKIVVYFEYLFELKLFMPHVLEAL